MWNKQAKSYSSAQSDYKLQKSSFYKPKAVIPNSKQLPAYFRLSSKEAEKRIERIPQF
jgi:hypothetical protein